MYPRFVFPRCDSCLHMMVAIGVGAVGVGNTCVRMCVAPPSRERFDAVRLQRPGASRQGDGGPGTGKQEDGDVSSVSVSKAPSLGGGTHEEREVRPAVGERAAYVGEKRTHHSTRKYRNVKTACNFSWLNPIVVGRQADDCT